MPVHAHPKRSSSIDPLKAKHMTTSLLPNFIAGRWQTGTGAGTPMFDPVLGTELARVSSSGIDLAEGFAFAREQGGAALRALSYGQRAALLTQITEVLQANRDAYYEIATANCGTTKNDSAVDIDGGIYTLGTYAKLAASLPDTRAYAGCKLVETYVDEDDPDTIILWEKWDERASQGTYMAWRGTQTPSPELAGALAAAPTFVHFTLKPGV